MTELTNDEFIYTIHSTVAASQRENIQIILDHLKRAAQGSSGYLGQDVVFDDSVGGELKVTTHVRFEELEQCLRWLDSPERRELITKAEQLVGYRFRFHLDANSFDQWIQSRGASRTPIWKANLLVWLALYPSVMLLM